MINISIELLEASRGFTSAKSSGQSYCTPERYDVKFALEAYTMQLS